MFSARAAGAAHISLLPPLSTREAVAIDTPAARATCASVLPVRPFLLCAARFRMYLLQCDLKDDGSFDPPLLKTISMFETWLIAESMAISQNNVDFDCNQSYIGESSGNTLKTFSF